MSGAQLTKRIAAAPTLQSAGRIDRADSRSVAKGERFDGAYRFNNAVLIHRRSFVASQLPQASQPAGGFPIHTYGSQAIHFIKFIAGIAATGGVRAGAHTGRLSASAQPVLSAKP
jgi:hypothetical protein